MGGGSKPEISDMEREKGGQKKQCSSQAAVEPFVPRRGHDPRELRSWAKRTGFVSTFSGETASYMSDRDLDERRTEAGGFDLEKGHERNGSTSPKIEIDPVLGRTKNREDEIEPILKNASSLPKNKEGHLRSSDGPARLENQLKSNGVKPLLGKKEEYKKAIFNSNGNDVGDRNGNRVPVAAAPVLEQRKEGENVDGETAINVYPDDDDPSLGGSHQPPVLSCGLRENPGFALLIYYGFQHYLSLAGSLIFIPLIIVPSMGGSDKDTATLISTMLLVSGITTILHSFVGTRLPLVQGSSFVYLAPALVVMNSHEFRNLSEHKFRHIMRELQGAIIISSIFQSILGFSGLAALLVRLINPIVVAPTVAAVGLAFFSYGFPQAGSCIEISLPQILLVLVFALYLRGISVFGFRIFRIYAVPLSVIIIWAYAFFLTAGGAYNYRGCSPNIPSSNILTEACRRHAYTMKHCRTDVSNAWRTAAWVRIPYPLQWGIPIFRLRTSIIMIIVSLVASVDSVGTYHSVSVRINSKPPTRGIVSRGIGLEGFCSILAGIWGTGTGSTTLTENVHTVNVTKMASRRALEIGAVFLIIFSFVGKIGALLASIPESLAAALLCFIWALLVALGLSNLQYSQAAGFRNITIVGVSLFLGLSIPAYFQQYQPEINLILPSYLIPYAAASNGPVHTGSRQLDFAINALLSLNMVVTLLVALVLDNTVPGSRQERGIYTWSSPEDIRTDQSSLSDYSLPSKVTRLFRWAKCCNL